MTDDRDASDRGWVVMAARVPLWLRKRARMIATREGRTFQDVLPELIEQWVKEREAESQPDNSKK